MKYIYILLILILFIITGCTPLIQAEPEPIIETRIETVIVTETVEIENTERIEQLEIEVQQYQDLIGNLNELLKNVYYGHAENENWILDGFTAFSIEYQGKFYLITAGHTVEENEYGRFYNHKFKANFSDEWIYPKLLTYENDFEGNRDYAILYSDKITSGLNFDLNNSSLRYILGNGDNNIFKEYRTYKLVEGESGSPVINIGGDVIEICIGLMIKNQDINIVLEAIDNLK